MPPPDVIDKLKELAKEHDRADLEPVLDSFSGAHHPRVAAQRTADRQRWHDLLDVVLDSNEADATTAVQQTLVVFANYARVQTSKVKQKKA